jgi:hypothetical protein
MSISIETKPSVQTPAGMPRRAPEARVLSVILSISSILFVGVEDVLGLAAEQGFTGAKTAYFFGRN